MPKARLTARALAVVGVVAVVSACAGVPRSGSVHVGRALPAVGGQEPINLARVIASGPVPNMTPARVVTGFLDALVDSNGNYEVARLYLAPSTVWHTPATTTLYGERSTTRIVGDHTVGVALQRVGTIDLRGNYRAAPTTLHTHFTLVRTNGQWRISHLPAGILLSTSDAERTLQPATIYFFNHAQTRLVPEPVLVPPDEPGLATTLIHELIDGPSRALAPAVSTAVPNGTALLGTVPIDRNGVASVDLAGSVQTVSADQWEQLSAQIVWTLRQLPGVTAVRLLVSGAPLSVAGVARVQSIGSWPQFDPEAPPTSRGGLVSDNGRVVGVGMTVPSSLASRGLLAPALSADGATAAALRSNGRRTTLLVGPAGGTLQPRWTARSISSPTFDPAGDVLAAIGVGRASRILEVPVDGPVHQVSVSPAIRAQAVTAMSISRDGSRIAMVVGPPAHQALVVGALTEVHGVDAVVSSTVVIPAAQDAEGVAWAGADKIVTTVRQSQKRRAVVETGVDGYQVVVLLSTGLPADPTQVAAAPGQATLAAAGGAVWTLSSTRWARVSTGRDPSYAG